MILIGADFVPTTSNTALFAGGNAEELFGSELNALLNSADYRIFNMETPLCDKPSPISKCGGRAGGDLRRTATKGDRLCGRG